MNMKRNVPQILSKAKKEPDVSDQAPCNSPHTQHFKRLLEYRMDNNLPQHPCANKCTDFKGEQCKTCLVQQIEKREFELGVAPDEAYVKTDTSDFLPGDVVVKIRGSDNALYVFATPNAINPKGCYIDRFYSKCSEYVPIDSIRSATTAEIQAKRRLTEAEQALAEVS